MVKLDALLTLALDKCEWSASHTVCPFPCREIAPHNHWRELLSRNQPTEY